MMDDMLTRSIKPLIQQHARDAVFYWQQINTGCFSPLITTQKRHHFHRQWFASSRPGRLGRSI